MFVCACAWTHKSPIGSHRKTHANPALNDLLYKENKGSMFLQRGLGGSERTRADQRRRGISPRLSPNSI